MAGDVDRLHRQAGAGSALAHDFERHGDEREAGTFGDALVGTFSIADTDFQFAVGIGLDFVGLRVGMAIAVAGWTLSSMSHAWVVGPISLFLARTTLGIFEGGGFPGCMKMSNDCFASASALAWGRDRYSGAAFRDRCWRRCW